MRGCVSVLEGEREVAREKEREGEERVKETEGEGRDRVSKYIFLTERRRVCM